MFDVSIGVQFKLNPCFFHPWSDHEHERLQFPLNQDTCRFDEADQRQFARVLECRPVHRSRPCEFLACDKARWHCGRCCRLRGLVCSKHRCHLFIDVIYFWKQPILNSMRLNSGTILEMTSPLCVNAWRNFAFDRLIGDLSGRELCDRTLRYLVRILASDRHDGCLLFWGELRRSSVSLLVC